jgi:hypothetical protein
MATSYLDKTGLEHLWGKIKSSDDTKVDKNQGAVNADKYLGTDSSGVVILRDGYNLPIATPTTLGGVKPIAKTADMSQAVGVDANGLLYTAAVSCASTADIEEMCTTLGLTAVVVTPEDYEIEG